MWTKPLVEAEALFIYSICISTQFSEYAGEAYYNLLAIYEVEFRLEFQNMFDQFVESSFKLKYLGFLKKQTVEELQFASK